MNKIYRIAILTAILMIGQAQAMAERLQIEKELEQLQEKNNRNQQMINRLIINKNIFLLSSFFSSMALGLKYKSYKLTFLPTALVFPALFYTQQHINLKIHEQENDAFHLNRLQKCIKKFSDLN